jgi:hypothetical protein
MSRKILLSNLATSCLVVALVLFASGMAYMTFEPETAHATVVTDSVLVTLNVTAGISITSPLDAFMSTALGVAQNVAVGSTTWTVATNDSAGYTLAVNATNSPAMISGSNSIADYQTGTPNTWNATTSGAYFGYSVFGTDVTTATWGTGANCNGATANATSTTLKYKGFTTSPFTVANRAATTTPTGVATTVCYAVEQNNFFIPSGTYTATIVATATSL